MFWWGGAADKIWSSCCPCCNSMLLPRLQNICSCICHAFQFVGPGGHIAFATMPFDLIATFDVCLRNARRFPVLHLYSCVSVVTWFLATWLVLLGNPPKMPCFVFIDSETSKTTIKSVLRGWWSTLKIWRVNFVYYVPIAEVMTIVFIDVWESQFCPRSVSLSPYGIMESLGASITRKP